MTAPQKLAAFALVLAASVGGGAALGAAVGPIDVDDEPTHDEPTHDEQPDEQHDPTTSTTTGGHEHDHSGF